MKVRYCTDRIVWCTFTPRFYVTRCIITPGFLVLISTVLRYLYNNTPGFFIPLSCFLLLLLVVFFTVCIGFNLRGSTLLNFLVGRTTSEKTSK